MYASSVCCCAKLIATVMRVRKGYFLEIKNIPNMNFSSYIHMYFIEDSNSKSLIFNIN